MTKQVQICRALAEDFEALCALYCHSVRCNPDGFIQDLTYHGCLTEKVRQWREAGGEMLVARLDGAVIGLGGLAPIDIQRVELCKLHVNPEYQGHGIGRLLCERLIEHAEWSGFTEIELHVTATQAAALALYRKLGFRQIRRVLFVATVFDMPAPFDTVYMTRALSGRVARAIA